MCFAHSLINYSDGVDGDAQKSAMGAGAWRRGLVQRKPKHSDIGGRGQGPAGTRLGNRHIHGQDIESRQRGECVRNGDDLG